MKKITILLINCGLFFSFIQNCYSQNADSNFDKYWFYRDRLKKRFMVMGNAAGEGLIAHEIYTSSKQLIGDGINYPNQRIRFGDQTILLGWYIAVLATEYKLLSDNNKSTAKTEEELYYAFKTFERLDFHAEDCPGYQDLLLNTPSSVATIQNVTPKLNGFFIRDDMYPNNYPPIKYTLESRKVCGKNDNSSIDLYYDNWVGANQNYGINGQRNQANMGLSGEMSQDQAYRMLMGMLFVYKMVATSATYKGLNFHAESKIVSLRILNWIRTSYLKADPNHATDGHETQGFRSDQPWIIVSPVTGYNVYRGSNTLLYSRGLSKLYRYYVSNSNCYAPVAWSYANNSMQFTSIFSPTNLAVAAAGGWPAFVPLAASFFNAGSITSSDNEVFYQLTSALASSLNFNFVAGIPTFNSTQAELDIRGRLTGMEIYPLMHAVLHNKNTKIRQSIFRDQLNEAPCSGPSRWGTQGNWQYDDVGWSSYNRYNYFRWERNGCWGVFNQGNLSCDFSLFGHDYNINLGTSQLNFCADPSQGEYNGLDYMLCFNLYNLNYSDYDNNNGNVPYFNKMDFESNVSFPYVYTTLNPPTLTAYQKTLNAAASLINQPLPYPQVQVQHEVGSTTNPITIEAFNSINYNGTISSIGLVQGNVIMHAGNDVHLKNGAHIGNGLSQSTLFYHAYAEPFCCNNGTYSRGSDSTSSPYNLSTSNSIMDEVALTDSSIKEYELSTIDEVDDVDSIPSENLILDSSLVRFYKNNQNISNPNPEVSALNLFPNPFASETKLTFFLNSPQKINIYLFNPIGQLVKTIAENEKGNTGIVTYTIKRDELSSGVYQLQLKTESGIINKQIVIQ